jgi:hypothetical protein
MGFVRVTIGEGFQGVHDLLGFGMSLILGLLLGFTFGVLSSLSLTLGDKFVEVAHEFGEGVLHDAVDGILGDGDLLLAGGEGCFSVG